MSRPTNVRDEQALMSELWDPALADDLRRFVQFVYPWGKEDTPLHRFKEPRRWQIEKLEAMTEAIRGNRRLFAELSAKKSELELIHDPLKVEELVAELGPRVFKDATASGRGPGKSTFVSWVTEWMLTTRLGSTVIVTANTEAQLVSRTWAEMGKWHTLAINSHWFEKNSLSLRPATWFKDALERQLKIDTGYYYAQGQLWKEENPDAFAGAHNMAGILLIFDEASGIPKPIWTVSEGFFTEPVVDRYWFCFSNPRRNTGEFFECFHKNRGFWRTTHIDSRRVEGTDKKVYDEIIAKHGEDSDEARIEVKGEFPRRGDNQFISRDVIENAVIRELNVDPYAGLVMGVDVARFGDDSSVIRFRQGRDARSIPPIKLKGVDNMALANAVAHWIQKTDPDAVCIDAGNGTGVIDRLRQMGFKVHEIHFGSSSPEPEYANMRTYMWGEMRAWLAGGCIDDDADLTSDLAGPEYKFANKSDAIMLEAKESMKGRGLASPDNGDALALTFAVKVARRDFRTSRAGPGGRMGRPVRMAGGVDYPLFS